jgi:small-conductance mechanosensitive channel
MRDEILNFTFYGNTVRVWLVALAVFGAVGLVLFVARSLVARRLAAIAARTATAVDDVVVDLLRRTRYYFIVAVSVAAASLVLTLPQNARDGVRTVAVFALLLQIAVWGNGVIQFWLKSYAARKAHTDGTSATTIAAFGVLARIALWILIALLALDNAGIQVTALITGLGITGVAVALAVQNILGDLFGALSIVLDKPFVVGDSIQVDTVNGTVEHIGLKTTRVRSITGEQVIFSNADLLKSRIRNFRRQEERRVIVILGVTYETPRAALARIPAMLRDIVEAQSHVRFDRAHFRSFGASALEYELVYYMTTADYLTYMDTQQAINLQIYDRFAAEKIAFAYPTQRVIADGGAPERATERTTSRELTADG